MAHKNSHLAEDILQDPEFDWDGLRDRLERVVKEMDNLDDIVDVEVGQNETMPEGVMQQFDLIQNLLEDFKRRFDDLFEYY